MIKALNICLTAFFLLFIFSGCNRFIRIVKPEKGIRGTYVLVKRKASAVSFDEKIQVKLILNEDSTISGNTGCNEFWGKYFVSGDKISVGPLASTRKLCENVYWDTELIRTLQESNRWALKKGVLKIETKGNLHTFWLKKEDQ